MDANCNFVQARVLHCTEQCASHSAQSTLSQQVMFSSFPKELSCLVERMVNVIERARQGKRIRIIWSRLT